MSSFTENLYLKRAIQKLQEENHQLLKLLNEVQNPIPPMFPPGSPPTAPEPPPSPNPYPFPPSEPGPSRPLPTPRPPINPRIARQGGGEAPPNTGPWWDPMYGAGGFGVPIQTPYPLTMPLPVKTPAPFTMPYKQPFSLNRPYDASGDPDNFRPARGMGDSGI